LLSTIDCSIARGSALTCASALSEPGRLSPPIWPCTTRGFPCLRCCHRSGGLLPHLFTLAKLSERFEDVSQVFLRDATVLLSAGGIFSVALSVNGDTGFSLYSCFAARLTSRKRRRTDQSLCHRPPGVTRRVALFRHRLLRAYDDGVRTFLPPSHLAMTKPAITRLTRQFNYTSAIGGSAPQKRPEYLWSNGGFWVSDLRCCFWSIFNPRRPIAEKHAREYTPQRDLQGTLSGERLS
jgi:hypothetical protein